MLIAVRRSLPLLPNSSHTRGFFYHNTNLALNRGTSNYNYRLPSDGAARSSRQSEAVEP
ncbi:hypothetical protein ACQY0O_006849 [Thecaphora frezii]